MSLISNDGRRLALPQSYQDPDSVTVLTQLLSNYRAASVTEREKGTYFEELILAYLRHEATYRDLYSRVWTWGEWAPANGFTGKDDGIDLVAEVAGTGEIHAIQCKFYDPDLYCGFAQVALG